MNVLLRYKRWCWTNKACQVFQKNAISLQKNEKAMITDVIRKYDHTLPFHNTKHALNVMKVADELMKCFELNKKERKCILFAALSHDIGHRGLTNSIIHKRSYDSLSDLDVTRTPSYNEIYHSSKAIDICIDHASDLDTEFLEQAILYTDLQNDKDFYQLPDSKAKTMISILKLADVGHILNDFYTHKKFVMRFHEEVGSDMTFKEIIKDTLDFNNTFVLPLVRLMKSDELIRRYIDNISIWKELLMRE